MRRVLVAEDDEGIRLTLGFLLEDEGFEVLFAADGLKALELSVSERPDVILLDHHMPKMEGAAVLDALRADPSLERVPVFILSGDSRVPAAAGTRTEFITKPFDVEDLMRRIHRALGE